MESEQAHLQQKVKELSEQLDSYQRAQQEAAEEIQRYRTKNQVLSSELAQIQNEIAQILARRKVEEVEGG